MWLFLLPVKSCLVWVNQSFHYTHTYTGLHANLCIRVYVCQPLSQQSAESAPWRSTGRSRIMASAELELCWLRFYWLNIYRKHWHTLRGSDCSWIKHKRGRRAKTFACSSRCKRNWVTFVETLRTVSLHKQWKVNHNSINSIFFFLNHQNWEATYYFGLRKPKRKLCIWGSHDWFLFTHFINNCLYREPGI